MSDVPVISEVLRSVAHGIRPPALWCPVSRCWVRSEPPHAPLDPALWRPVFADYLRELEHAGPEVYGLPNVPLSRDGRPVRTEELRPVSWGSLAKGLRYLSGPVVRDLKEIVSGDPLFRRESAMSPERWLSLCRQSAGGFASRRDLLAAFRLACPDAVIGDRAFLVLARGVLGRDGRFGPMGARGPWGFRVVLPGREHGMVSAA